MDQFISFFRPVDLSGYSTSQNDCPYSGSGFLVQSLYELEPELLLGGDIGDYIGEGEYAGLTMGDTKSVDYSSYLVEGTSHTPQNHTGHYLSPYMKGFSRVRCLRLWMMRIVINEHVHVHQSCLMYRLSRHLHCFKSMKPKLGRGFGSPNLHI